METAGKGRFSMLVCWIEFPVWYLVVENLEAGFVFVNPS
jgi:hypothetical protein